MPYFVTPHFLSINLKLSKLIIRILFLPVLGHWAKSHESIVNVHKHNCWKVLPARNDYIRMYYLVPRVDHTSRIGYLLPTFSRLSQIFDNCTRDLWKLNTTYSVEEFSTGILREGDRAKLSVLLLCGELLVSSHIVQAGAISLWHSTTCKNIIFTHPIWIRISDMTRMQQEYTSRLWNNIVHSFPPLKTYCINLSWTPLIRSTLLITAVKF